MIDYFRVGLRIKMHRSIENISLQELSCRTKLDVRTIRSVEQGKNTDYDTIDTICRALDIDTQYTLNPDNPAAREKYLANLYADEEYNTRLERIKAILKKELGK